LATHGAEVIDARNMIVMPGFVEVHWHMWNSIWRGLAHDAPGYFGLHRLAPLYTAEDHYNAVRYAATEAINAGVTTCHDWANALRGPEDDLAEARALVDTGIRARLGLGRLGGPNRKPIGAEDIAAAQGWLDENGDGLIDLGVVCHDADTIREEVLASRAAGLKTVAPHANLAGVLDLLGPDFIFTHGPGTPAEFMQLLAARGVKIGLCPSTDPLIGAGLPPILQFLDNGVAFRDIGMSVDVTCQTSVDPFGSMRTIMNSGRIAKKDGASFEQIVFTPADPNDHTNGLLMPDQMLDLATVNGAHVLGLGAVTGTLSPGKRADLIMVRTDDINMLPVEESDAAFQLVQQGQVANVDTVMVDGRILKRDGKLVGVNPREIAAAAAASHRRLVAAAKAAA
jgi:cytosine/adenosine deaminase-related metal-dependent hydrolase